MSIRQYREIESDFLLAFLYSDSFQ